MKTMKLALVCLVVWCATAVSAEAGGFWRPCGPGNSCGGNRLIPQGAFGADFRPACAQHDACLAAGCCRRDCDKQFLCNMQSACECSRHPLLCRARARHYYLAARLFGGLYY